MKGGIGDSIWSMPLERGGTCLHRWAIVSKGLG